jgi:hypothetical protein
MRQQKRLLRSWDRSSVDDAIQGSIAEFAQAFTTGEPQVYMGGFRERRR